MSADGTDKTAAPDEVPGTRSSAQPGRGPDLAREALARAQAGAATARREQDRSAAAKRRGAGGPRRRRPASGDSADPVTFGEAIDGLLTDRGWTHDAAVASVTARWEQTVGEEIAAHCSPVGLRDGVLTVEAESTAWATQLRMLSHKLLARIAEVAGAGVVTRLVVHGPVSPSWRKGALRVPGRGPRDTYG